MIHGGNMKMFLSFIAGLIISFIIGLISSSIWWNSDDTLTMANKALADCERSLPRDQQCYIIAVPPSKD
jgi:hypothetical protein